MLLFHYIIKKHLLVKCMYIYIYNDIYFRPFFYHLQPIVMTKIDPDICYSGGGEKIIIYGENFLKGEIYYVRLLSCREEDHVEKYTKATLINNGMLQFMYNNINLINN